MLEALQVSESDRSKTAAKQDDDNDDAALPKNENMEQHPQPRTTIASSSSSCILIDSDDEEELGALIYRSSRTYASLRNNEQENSSKVDEAQGDAAADECVQTCKSTRDSAAALSSATNNIVDEHIMNVDRKERKAPTADNDGSKDDETESNSINNSTPTKKSTAASSTTATTREQHASTIADTTVQICNETFSEKIYAFASRTFASLRNNINNNVDEDQRIKVHDESKVGSTAQRKASADEIEVKVRKEALPEKSTSKATTSLSVASASPPNQETKSAAAPGVDENDNKPRKVQGVEVCEEVLPENIRSAGSKNTHPTASTTPLDLVELCKDLTFTEKIDAFIARRTTFTRVRNLDEEQRRQEVGYDNKKVGTTAAQRKSSVENSAAAPDDADDNNNNNNKVFSTAQTKVSKVQEVVELVKGCKEKVSSEKQTSVTTTALVASASSKYSAADSSSSSAEISSNNNSTRRSSSRTNKGKIKRYVARPSKQGWDCAKGDIAFLNDYDDQPLPSFCVGSVNGEDGNGDEAGEETTQASVAITSHPKTAAVTQNRKGSVNTKAVEVCKEVLPDKVDVGGLRRHSARKRTQPSENEDALIEQRSTKRQKKAVGEKDGSREEEALPEQKHAGRLRRSASRKRTKTSENDDASIRQSLTKIKKENVDTKDKAKKSTGSRCTHKKPQRCRHEGCEKWPVKGGVCNDHGADKRSCNYTGCNKYSKKSGLCIRHARLKYPDYRPYTRKTCSHTGCDSRAVSSGVCTKHGAKKYKPICNHEGCTKHIQAGWKVCVGHGAKVIHKQCSHAGCTKYSQRGGVCIEHGAQHRRCSHEGCQKRSQKNGVCVQHGAKMNYKRCSHDGCGKYAKAGGVCIRHGAVITKRICKHKGCTKTAKSAAGVCWVHGANLSSRRCSQDGCDKYPQKGGMCIRHRKLLTDERTEFV